MKKSSSLRTQEIFAKLDLFRGVVATGASASPAASVVVAGLFIAFDLFTMYQSGKASISEIIVNISDISQRNDLRHHFIESQPHEHTQLQEARSELKAALVQLKRTSLLPTMNLACTLNSRLNTFLSMGSWRSRLQTLKDAENRVTGYVRDIHVCLQSPPPTVPNWTDKQIPRLYRLVRDRRVDDTYRLTNTGQCTPAVLNEQTATGWTALMVAARDGQYEILT